MWPLLILLEGVVKKTFGILCCLFALTGVSLALYGTAYGKFGTATTVVQRLSGFTANSVSVYNAGTNNLLTVPNCPTNVFTTRVTAGTAIVVPGGKSFTYNSGGETSIDSLCLATTNGTVLFYIGAF